MPKRELQDVWGLLWDLFREFSWPLRLGFFGGLAAGCALGVCLVTQVPRVELRFGLGRAAVLFVVGLVILGGLLGLAAGGLADLAWRAFFADEPPARRKRKR